MRSGDPHLAIAERAVPGGRLLRRWPLVGGVSARVEALEIERGGSTTRVVVRSEGADWKALGAGSSARDFALLSALHAAGLEVPLPYFADDSRELLPTPFLVLSFVEGTTDVDAAALPDALRQMASFLARLHALPVHAMELPDLPRGDDPIAGVLRYLPESIGPLDDELLERVSAGSWRQANAPALLHGDFWPGNILWEDGRLAAVLDWEDASVGDPLSDLACCRIELACRHGEPAMDAFTAHYLSFAPLDTAALPWWELYASSAALALMAQWGLDPADEAARRRTTSRLMHRALHEVRSRRASP
jgi:aminoglycoside phosphotransferase (APT) family kinase protein